MNNKDFIQRFIFENAPVRGELVRLDLSYQTIMNQHQYPEPIRHLLAETLVISNLLSAIIKFEGRLTVQFQGKGKLSLLLAQCTNDFHFRGLAQWKDTPDQTELIDALKNGNLVIMIDPNSSGKHRYQGIVEWQGKSLTETIEGYFEKSEQLPTRLWVAVNETSAVGLLLQIMPRENAPQYQNDWEHIVHLTETIKSDELLNCDNTTILHRLYHEENVRLFDPVAVEFRCTCSQEKSENALLLLGEEEAEKELQEKQKIVVKCEFCSREFVFDRVDVAKIFKKGRDSNSKIH